MWTDNDVLASLSNVNVNAGVSEDTEDFRRARIIELAACVSLFAAISKFSENEINYPYNWPRAGDVKAWVANTQ